MDIENQTVDNLLGDIIKILEIPFKNGNPDSVSNQAPQNTVDTFRSVQIIKEAKTISKSEAVLLKEAATLREEALVHLRKNEIGEGNLKLQLVKEMMTNNNFSVEATLIFSTFQSAAESFLHLKKGHYEKNYGSV